MSRKFFGTDGVRGVANKGKMTPEMAMKIGMAAGTVLRQKGLPPQVVVGRDTRRSGPMLATAMIAGFNSAGVDALAIGVAPTPAVAFCARRGYGLGVVISASHNPAGDNGIKLLSAEGGKVSDDFELEVEALLETDFADRPTGVEVGSLTQERGLLEFYADFLVGLVPERLDGMKIAVDCANGAAFDLGPLVLQRLGAEVVSIGIEPDGRNINLHGGATHPAAVQKLVVETGADIGVAFDGDADRAVFSDDQGRLINGDRTMGIWGAHWHVDPPVIVGTVMSNTGFERYLDSQGIRLERAKVGDKYVSEQIAAHNAKVGGEQSGHIIFPHHGPTGDGLVTMLELLRVLKREERKASSFYDDFANWPQTLVNMNVGDLATWRDGAGVVDAIREAEEIVAGRGRVNLRPSGTQPIVRVMIEAEEADLRDRARGLVVDALCAGAGGSIYSETDLTTSLGE
jgi:phosphoglucosamine mutase